ncbi:MAG: phosphoribosylanthranilate isomerase [Ancrocorticia populi]|uniref:phosphoribosylanthranilate isomerase n=1 Tax=Ancrocorticia populi TaxID=2175228 RepID=UPI003F90AB50
MYIKICGLKTPEDVAVAIGAGADAIGVVHAEGSPRNLDESAARNAITSAAGAVDTALVVASTPVHEAVDFATAIGASVLQLHGRYTPEDVLLAAQLFPRVWRATALRPDTNVEVGAYGEERLLLDAPRAGSGERWDTSALENRRPTGQWLLAGGLDPRNVASAIETARPWGVDVSSGVESARGVKSHALIREFVANARAAS